MRRKREREGERREREKEREERGGREKECIALECIKEEESAVFIFNISNLQANYFVQNDTLKNSVKKLNID
jgi:hypothetical protein